MAAYLTPEPKLQFFSTAGVPLAGGKIYTYDAGTTTPLATFADSAGITNNPNPVILDSRGEASIWLGTQSYKFKLTTPDDVEIWTVDNISLGPFPDSTASIVAAAVTAVGVVYAASDGSDLIGHKGTGAAATVTTVGAKLRQIVNIKDYGAVGDGVADDTLAVQRAITNSTGIVYIPAGTFKITGVTLTAGKQLIGENRATSILKLGAALSGTGMINATYANDIVVENLTIDGGSLVGTKNGLINYYGCERARIENNIFTHVDQFAIACNSMNYAVIRGNSILMTQLVGAWIDTAATAGFLAGSGGPLNTTGLVGTISAPAGPGGVQAAFTYSTDGTGAVIASSIVFSTNGRGYLTDPTASFPAVPGSFAPANYGGAQVVAITYAGAGGPTPVVGENVEISHNYIENGGCNLTLRSSNIFGNLVRNVIYGAAFVSEQAAGVARNIYSSNVISRVGYCTIASAPYTNTYIGPDTDNTVNSGFELWGAYEECLNNVCFFNAASGISFGSQGGVCSNNVVFDNGQYWATLTGNPVQYTTRGIQIPAGNATYNGSYSLVANNRCFDQNAASGTQGYGIGADNSIASPLVGLKFVDNDCFGNRLAPYIKENATVTYFRGRRIEGRSAVNPASIAAAGAADYPVTVPGLDTGNWLLSSNFIGVTTEPMMMTTRYSAANTAIVRLFNFSASPYDLPSGSLLVQAEEVIA